jgi:peptidoglycan hydrolase-like protein with peptidoglycan-binding domain
MNLGYYGGPISGFMNPDLQAALRAFQAGKGLQQLGEADDATKAALQQEHTS